MTAHRFPDAPANILKLRTDHRGFPVPWFVDWPNGKPDFRIIARGRVRAAVKARLCWVCGKKIGRTLAFVIGPMCAINRISAEPPSHLQCAVFSAAACPFLTQPKMRRNEKGLPEERYAPGEMITRNPGVALVWSTLSYKLVDDGNGGKLFKVGLPTRTQWFAQGREATREEVEAAISSGLPLLENMARQQDEEEPGAGAMEELRRTTDVAMKLVPA